MPRPIRICRYRKGGDGKPKKDCPHCKQKAEQPKGKGER